MDTKKLRQKILDLAIRGKLVPQDPNDEPASVLLERIRTEKERLIAEGKIKRPKKSKTSSSESHYQKFEPPFLIPGSWEWVRLEDCCSIITDGDHQAPPKSKEGIPFLVISDVISGKLNFDNCRFVPITYYNSISEDRKPIKDDILFTVTGSYGVPVRVNTADKFCFQRHIGLIRPIFVTDWLFHVLLSRFCMAYCDKYATGTAQKTVGLQTLRDFYVPLPPLEEQRLIIKSVSNWLNNITQLSLASSSLTDYLKLAKSKILELAMQGKLVPQDPADEPAADMLRRVNPNARIITDNPHYWNIPKNWCWCQIGDLFHHNTGKALNSSNKEGDEYEYITTSNVYWNRFELVSLKRMLYKDSEIDKCKAVKGDLLVCEGGDVGRSAIWNMDFPIMIQNHLHRLRPVSEQISPSLYLHVFKLYKDKNLIGGKGIAIQGFSSNALHQLVVPCVPYSEQKRIVAKIEELYAVLDEMEASLQS